MMVTAQQHAIVEAGHAAVDPGHDVVTVGPPGRPITMRKRASTITKDQGAPDRSGEEAPLPPQIEKLARTAEHGRNDLRIAGQPPDRGRTQQLAGVEQADAERAGHLIEIDGHGELRSRTPVIWKFVGRQREPAHVDQGVRSTLRRRARVIRPWSRSGKRVDGGPDRCCGFGVDAAGEAYLAMAYGCERQGASDPRTILVAVELGPQRDAPCVRGRPRASSSRAWAAWTPINWLIRSCMLPTISAQSSLDAAHADRCRRSATTAAACVNTDSRSASTTTNLVHAYDIFGVPASAEPACRMWQSGPCHHRRIAMH
jgi:hypothetical protein